jgi:ABC-2 type transport system ATP-binding protein
MMKAIQISNLAKTYANGTEALKGIDLTINEGDFFALLGANGAGKTTIIGILTGLVKKTSGEISIFGFDVSTQSMAAREITGIVPQELNFNQFEKVLDIMTNYAGFFGIKRDVALERSEKLLKQLELWDKRNEISRNLSGGMKRRLMIARALVNEPKLLILDEPTAGVDVELRHSMWQFLNEINKNGTTILLTTHYLEEVEKMCRAAAIIKDGEIIKNDSVRNLHKLVDSQTFVIHVDHVEELEKLKNYKPVVVDSHTLEVEFDEQNNLNQFISDISKLGIIVKDFQPRENRMEKLFLKILKS